MEATLSTVDKITVQDILDARERIAPHVHKTPLLPFHASWDSTSEKKRVSQQMEPWYERKDQPQCVSKAQKTEINHVSLQLGLVRVEPEAKVTKKYFHKPQPFSFEARDERPRKPNPTGPTDEPPTGRHTRTLRNLILLESHCRCDAHTRLGRQH